MTIFMTFSLTNFETFPRCIGSRLRSEKPKNGDLYVYNAENTVNGYLLPKESAYQEALGRNSIAHPKILLRRILSCNSVVLKSWQDC